MCICDQASVEYTKRVLYSLFFKSSNEVRILRLYDKTIFPSDEKEEKEEILPKFAQNVKKGGLWPLMSLIVARKVELNLCTRTHASTRTLRWLTRTPPNYKAIRG